MNDLLQQYAQKKKELKKHLNLFTKISEEQKYSEFIFCLLTPQSNAQRCWQAVEEITKLNKLNEKSVFNILKTKTRFHITKTQRIMQAEETWKKIKPLLNNSDIQQLRKDIADNVNGMGLKEASHFLRNIGLSKNQIAILDRHILRNLQKYNLIKEPKIKSQKHYLQIETIYLNFANSINIPADELDMLWWSQENGEIFK